jgi:membrane fusion protein (multidrug efflux system)
MNSRRWIITVTACLLLFAGLATYKVLQIRAAIEFGQSFPEPSETVEAFVVEAQTLQDYVTTIGQIVAPQSIELRNEVAGRVAQVNFASGALVKEGDILLQFDVAEERARLQAARARADLARLDLQRIKALKDSNTVSQERFDQAAAQDSIARAEVLSLQALIDKKTLRAPFAAIAGIHQFEQGDLLQANTLITILVGVNGYTWVDFQLPAGQAEVAIGTAVLVNAAGHPGQPLQAQVVAKDSTVSAQSRNLRLRARMASNLELAPNTVVNVAVPVGQPQPRAHVPVTALRLDGLGDYVFVLEPTAPATQPKTWRARRASVTVGPQSGQSVAILDGLEPGELVAANGSFKLRANLLVYVGQRPDSQANANAAPDVAAQPNTSAAPESR